MKFAVTYDNGQVFQHFGQTREFKVYTVNGSDVTSEVVGAGQFSHGTLATLLDQLGVEALVCGGIGDGARNMLVKSGIQVFAGNSGNADDVAKLYIEGKLSKSTKSTCRDDHDCHCH